MARAQYAAGAQIADRFLLAIWDFPEVCTDDFLGGVVFDVGEAEGAQSPGDFVRCAAEPKVSIR